MTVSYVGWLACECVRFGVGWFGGETREATVLVSVAGHFCQTAYRAQRVYANAVLAKLDSHIVVIWKNRF